MDTILSFYFCIVIPLLFVIKMVEAKSRKYVLFIIIGCTACLLAAIANSTANNNLDFNYQILTTTYTPINEEILKALPVLIFAIFFSKNEKELIGIGFACGIGFAILENCVIFLQSGDTGIFWAILRGLSTSVMHGLTTAFVGSACSLVHKRRKMFVTGLLTVLTLAITYHAIFNVFVQSQYQIVAIVLPICTYLLLSLGSSDTMMGKLKNKIKQKLAL